MIRIAVLLAVFNRKEKTITCLRSLWNQNLPNDVSFDVYLTDDNSTDGTSIAVLEEFPDVKLLKGSGLLFWAGGMRNSWREALKGDYDYYLLLNDDTFLNQHTLSRLVDCSLETQNNGRSICIGSTADRDKELISYGGHRLVSPKKVKYESVYSETAAVECDLANANIMLVPKKIVDTIGILSDNYTHSIADFDYTLRAKKAGFKNVVLPGVAGYCVDDHGNNWRSAKVPLRDRINYLKSPKGLAYSEYMHFIKEHFPSHVPEAFVKLWMKTLFPGIWDKFKVSNA